MTLQLNGLASIVHIESLNHFFQIYLSEIFYKSPYSTIKEAVKMLKHSFGQSEQIIEKSIDRALSAEILCENKHETIDEFPMYDMMIMIFRLAQI